jgi:predicted transposase YdaD
LASDKLFYLIFHSAPDLILRWLQDLQADAGGYSFSAPVLKEREYRLDGLFSPPAQRPDLRDWRVVVICPNRELNF